jgi:prephenate dehydrogenase
MARAVRDDTKIVFVANPNNPTGTFSPWSEVLAFVENIPPRVLVVLDEAYGEYLPDELASPSAGWLAAHPNLVVARTLSKAFGLAGLRVGYAYAHPDVAEVMNRVRQPFNVNHLAMVAACAALDDHEFIARSRDVNARGLAQLERGFEALGLEYVPARHGRPSGAERPVPRGAEARSRERLTMRRLKTLAVVGVGLVGGSFALGARRAGIAPRVVGFDRDRGALETAASLGVIDTAADSVSEAVKGADLVLVAVPVRAIGPVLHDVALAMEPDAVVTDVGSTKEEVVRVARDELRDRFPRFVPGHPIAGRETSGVESALQDLFRGARVVLTPASETAPDAVDVVRGAWEAIGGKVAIADAADHDRIFAAVSHLPHILSFALVSEIASRENRDELLGFAAGGFRDFTRIAASSPQMWRDIALQNRAALLAEIDRYGARLAVFRELIERGEAAGLERLMTEARTTRTAWAGKRGPTD